MSAWEEIRELILAVDERRLADRVIALDAAGRAEVARRLPGFLKELRDPATRPAWRPLPVPQYLDEDADEWPAWVRESNEQAIRWRTGDPMEDLEVPLRIAGAGTISGPAAVAAWLARRWHDPAFPQAFPWFGTPRYWEEHVLQLREQAALMQEPPLNV